MKNGKRPLSFLPGALDDVEQAIAWYSARSESASERFFQSLQEVFERLRSSPWLYAVDPRGVRQAKLKDFPYVVAYRILPDVVEILAVAHGSRRPGHWRARLRDSDDA